MLFARHLSSSAASKTLVEVFYDVISPYTYFQVELLHRQRPHWTSMQYKLTPVSIASIMRAAENMPPLVVPAKAVYMIKDLATLSNFHKVPFKMRSDFAEFAMNMGSKKTQCFLQATETLVDEETQIKLVRAFFARFFSPNSANLNDDNEIRAIASENGLSEDIILKAMEVANSDAIRAKLKENSNRVVELGGFGLPVTLVHRESKPQWVFGSDRLHIVGHLLGESKPPQLN